MDARGELVARRFEPWMLAAALFVIPTIVLEESEVNEPWSMIAVALNWVIRLRFWLRR